jgi:hypothetical protein
MRGSKGTAPAIPNPDSLWKWVNNFHVGSFFLLRKLEVVCVQRMIGNWKISLLPNIKTKIVALPPWSTVSIRIMPSRLLHWSEVDELFRYTLRESVKRLHYMRLIFRRVCNDTLNMWEHKKSSGTTIMHWIGYEWGKSIYNLRYSVDIWLDVLM